MNDDTHCRCSRIRIGTETTQQYSIRDDCELHGRGTPYYEKKLEEHRARMAEIRSSKK